MGEWIDELTRRHAESGTERVLLLFNNCQRSQASVNARQMRALLETQAPQLNVVSAFASPLPVQKTLFEG